MPCTDIAKATHRQYPVETGRARMRNNIQFVKNLQLCEENCTRFSLRGRKLSCMCLEKSNKILCVIFFLSRHIPFM